MAWRGYKELIVWQKAMDLVEETYLLTKKLPKEETFSLADQMRRAAVSVPSNIAEGHGRFSDKEFLNFLSIARGSCFELETQLLICCREKFLEENETEKALLLCSEISKMLTQMLKPKLK